MQFADLEIFTAVLVVSTVLVGGVVALFFYYRRFGYPHLKFGAYALLLETFSQALHTTAVLLELPILYPLVLLSRFGVGLMLYVAITHIAKTKVNGVAIVAACVMMVGAFLAGLVLNLSDSVAWQLLEIPALLLVMFGALSMFGARWNQSPSLLTLALLLPVYIVSRLFFPHLLDEYASLALVYFVSTLCVLASAAAFCAICSEWLDESLHEQEDRLHRVEQENRRLEMQFSQAQKLESLGVLAGGIAHDFNNMLTSILGYTSLAIQKLPVDSEVRKDLYMVMSGARQAVDLTSQMLVYAGKGAIEFETVNVSNVVDNMGGLINSIVPRKIHVGQKITRDLPLVKGDPVQLGQIVMNLVANAVDAVERVEGTIEISTGLSDVDAMRLQFCLFATGHEEGAYAYIKVKDNGIGIEPDQVERIFDPFYSDKLKNKGLGLSSISGIVRQHNGFVEVVSKPGEGSEFTVFLPVVSYQDAASVSYSNIPFANSPAPKGRVLLADDDSRIRSLIASVLEKEGFDVTSVEDGRDAMQQIEKGNRFDLYVVDCTMPKLSGTDVYREIRSAGLKEPVILISGYNQEQVIRDIDNDLMAGFLKKPFSVDDLRETVGHYASKLSTRSTQD